MGLTASCEGGAAFDELVELEVVGSAFLSSDPQPARARPTMTAMMAIPPALTFLIESPVSVEICAMTLRSANVRWKENRREPRPSVVCPETDGIPVCLTARGRRLT